MIISADDHLIEPPDLFEDRLPEKYADVAPKVVETEAGHQVWRYGGATYPCAGLDVGAGLPREQWTLDPVRFDNMRPGCHDIEARIEDMDVAGIWAALCFPGMVAGQAGMPFARTRDQELGLALVKAYNDWHIDVWAGTYPERIIGLQLPWLPDPEHRRQGDPGQRGAGLQGRGVPRVPDAAAAAVDPHRPLGPVLRRLRGDRHRRVPAHRRVVAGRRCPRRTRPSRRSPR